MNHHPSEPRLESVAELAQSIKLPVYDAVPDGYEFIEGPRNEWDGAVYPGHDTTYLQDLMKSHPDIVMVRREDAPSFTSAYAPIQEQETSIKQGFIARFRRKIGGHAVKS